MKVTVKLFASFREAAGWRSRELEVPAPATAGDVLALLRRTTLLTLPAGMRPLLAVNHQHVQASHALAEGDEVAVFPPVSGGAPGPLPPTVSSGPLDARLLAESVRHPSCGAVVTFEGTVRDHAEGFSVEAVEYEAYEAMATEVLAAIVLEVETRHPGVRLALAHRTGRLAVGEVSVVAAASAPHRREAFAACRLALDRVKEALPVWKHEHGAEGGSRWR